MYSKILFISCLFISFIGFSQNNYVDSLHIRIASLTKSNESLQEEVNLKSSLIKDVKGEKLDKELDAELRKLKDTISKNEIEIFKSRSYLPSNDLLSIKPIANDILENKQLEILKKEIDYLDKKKKSNGLEERDLKLLEKKVVERDKLEAEVNREILEAFELNNLVNDVPVLKVRNLDNVTEETRKGLQSDRSIVLDKHAQYLLTEDSKGVFKNSKIEYRATIINSHFTIPVVRFNQVKDDPSKEGNIQLFNSIGAGISYSAGRLIDIRDSNGELIDTEFNNSWGLSLGVLFSAGSANGVDRNVFAPMASFNLLDFQIGYGVELGTRAANQKRGFFTIAYSIPLYKLTKGKFRIIKKGKIINDVIEN